MILTNTQKLEKIEELEKEMKYMFKKIKLRHLALRARDFVMNFLYVISLLSLIAFTFIV